MAECDRSGAIIESGEIIAIANGGYRVISYDRPGIITPVLKPLDGSDEFEIGQKVFYFLFPTGDGAILDMMLAGQFEDYVNKTDFEALKTRVTVAEEDIDDQEEIIEDHEETIGTHTTQISTLTQSTTALDGRVTTAESTITQQATQIASKVSQTDFDELEGTVESHTTSITQQATAIQSKASQSSVDTLTGRVTTAESTITQQATQIASKVSQTDFDELEGTVESHTTSISQTPTMISAAVSAVRNVNKNHVIESNTERKNSDFPSAEPHVVAVYNVDAPLEAGKVYTVTICFTPASSVTKLCPHLSEGLAWLCDVPVSGLERQIVSAQFVARYAENRTPENNPVNANVWVASFQNDVPVTEDTTIHWIKIEDGFKATDWCACGDDGTVINSALTMDQNGIRMTGGEIDMRAGTAFRVKSGGTVEIDTAVSENSHINLGDGNFSASKDGGVVAGAGHFGALDVQGKRVLTNDDISAKIVVSHSQPTGHGIIWVQPTSINSVKYSAFTASSRNDSVNFAVTNPITRSFAIENSDTLPDGSITYTMIVPIYSVSATMDNFSLGCTLTKNSQTVTLTTVSGIQIRPWTETSVTLTATSNVNLCANTGNISVSLTGNRNGSSGSVYVQKDTNLELTCSLPAQSGTMACNITYIQ